MELKIDKEKLLAAWQQANEQGKLLLEEVHGKEVFAPDLKEMELTMRDICVMCGEDYDQLFSEEVRRVMTPDEVAYREMKLIARAFNKGWKADYSDSDQYKYLPWFKWVSGRGLSFIDAVCDFSGSSVGPRLVFENAELVQTAIEKFPDTYNTFFNQ